MVSNLEAMASNLFAMASNLTAMASDLTAMSNSKPELAKTTLLLAELYEWLCVSHFMSPLVGLSYGPPKSGKANLHI